MDRFRNVFNLGLKHIPIPTDTSDSEIDAALERFKHRVGWSFYFNRNKKEKESEELWMKFRTRPKPFTFTGHYSKALEPLKTISDKFDEYKCLYPSINRSSTLLRTLYYLKKQNDLVWTASDKNLGLVCMSLQDYNYLVQRHLQSDKYLLVGKHNTTKFFDTGYQESKREFIKLVSKTILPRERSLGHKQIINFLEEQLERAQKDEFQYPAFHVLPKIHKGLTNLSSRPIVGAIDWFTTPISKLLSFYLRELLKSRQVEGMIQNTQDVVSKLQGIRKKDITSRTLLVTMDIESLYTNIKLEYIHEVLLALDPYYKVLAEFINSHNKFTYLDFIYKQTDGIAMGTNAAPEIANVYLVTFLDAQFQELKDYAHHYCRYLDDLFFLWNGSEEQLQIVLDKLQVCIPGIKFATKWSNDSVDFLDLTISKKGDEIHYYTHQKAMNRYGYITPSSTHPLHTFKGWITAELNRYKGNSSHRIYYERTKELFYQRLIERGYPRRFLIPIFAKHYFVFPPKTLKESKPLIPLVLRFSKRKEVVKFSKNLLLSNTTESLKRLLPDHRFMVTWKKSRSIFDILCSSRLNTAQIRMLTESKVEIPNHSSKRVRPIPSDILKTPRDSKFQKLQK